MWFITGHKWNPGFQPAEEPPPGDDAWDWGNFNRDDRPSAAEVRVHGNPMFDTGTAGWQEKTGDKRAENDYYRAVYAGEDPDLFGIKDWFINVPGKLNRVQGSFYLIDIDDPELVEHGEEFIHKELTSHLAEIYLEPKSKWEPWVADCKKYSDDLFFNNLSRGYADIGAIVTEAIRQQLGLPYQWMGAPID